MNRKTFFGGVAAGILVCFISIGVINTTSVTMSAKLKDNMPVEEKMSYIMNLLDSYYVEDIQNEELLEGAYYGMVSSIGDPYTSYLTIDQVNQFRESTNGSFMGVGINVIADLEKGVLTVISPIPNTPAESAGIKPGDTIIKVDGKDVVGLDSNEVISLIKGEENTEVTITVIRDEKELDFTMNRENVEVPSIYGKMLDDNLAYIEISGFKVNTYEQFVEEYERLMSEGAKGLIIDVRDNPGGVLEVVNKIADEIIPKGIIVYTIDKDGNRIDYKSDANHINVPLVVLVNGNSASASEILAGAVQDSKTGVLVGTQTFGKGLVQNLYPLPDGSAVKITIQKYYTPKGVCIQGEGIEPDYITELPEGKFKATITDSKEDTQLQKAIEVLKEKGQ